MTDQLTACPYLGLPDDPRTRFSFATPAHRCHVERKPSPIDLDHQGIYCLSSDFPACRRLIARLAAIEAKAEPARTVGPAVVTAIPEVSSPIAAPPVAAPPVAPAPAAPPPVAASARDYSWPSAAREAVPSLGSTASPWATPWGETALPVTAPPVSRRKRPWTADVTPVKGARARLPQTAPLAARSRIRPTAGGFRARFRTTPLPFGGGRNLRRGALILLVVLALAAAVATGALARLLPSVLLPRAEASAAPTAVASPSRSTSPTLVPSAGAASPVTHVVQPDESLTSIAARYGVTPQAIGRANDLKDANLLRIGQKLIIPTAN